jgi:hypothetical protein
MDYSANKLIDIMVGGGLLSTKSQLRPDFWTMFLFTLLIIFIKGFIVMITYNYIMPKMMNNIQTNYNYSKFEKITIWESIILMLLISNLVNKY